MSMQPHQQALVTAITIASAGIAAIGVVSITALQSDVCSRRWLSPHRLYAKRAHEYSYKWSQAVAKTCLQLQYYWAGGSAHLYNAEMEALLTDIFTQPDEIQAFCKEQACDSDICIGRIDTFDSDVNKEYCIWFHSTRNEKLYQLPLLPTALQLADQLERQITRTTFCFVTDASSGAATDLIVDLVDAVAKDDTVLTIRQPAWMIVLARLMERQVIETTKLERCLFGLMRCEAAQRVTTQDTVVVTIPQAAAPVLLPALQRLFPDDRHVFSYDTCLNSVQTAVTLQKSARRAVVPTSLEEAVQFTDLVAITTPFSKTSLAKSTNVMPPFPAALQALPVHLADTTETWMAAVDAFFALKEQDDEAAAAANTNNDIGYMPYVFRLDYITKPGPCEYGSNRYWATVSLLQHVTGSRSRQLTEPVQDAIVSWLRDVAPPAATTAFSAATAAAIENCVFQHKLILIAHKTLKDTVQPVEHWSLKDTTRRGCSCCLIEPEDDDEDGAATGGASKLNMNLPGAFASSNVSSASGDGATKYVDGKMAFAFDPTKFS